MTAIVGLAIGSLAGSFGLPRLDTMWLLHRIPVMGPLCGATRSVALATVGDLRGAWAFNPLGVALVVGAWATVAREVVGRLTGRWVTPFVAWRIATPTIVAVLVLLTVRQQLHASYLLENVVLP